TGWWRSDPHAEKARNYQKTSRGIFRASFEQGGTPCVRQVRPQNDLEPRSDSIRSEKALIPLRPPVRFSGRVSGTCWIRRGPMESRFPWSAPGLTHARPDKRKGGCQEGLSPSCKKKTIRSKKPSSEGPAEPGPPHHFG